MRVREGGRERGKEGERKGREWEGGREGEGGGGRGEKGREGVEGERGRDKDGGM